MKIFNELNEKFIELPEIIQNFMRKLLKKLEITIINPKTGKIPLRNEKLSTTYSEVCQVYPIPLQFASKNLSRLIASF